MLAIFSVIGAREMRMHISRRDCFAGLIALQGSTIAPSRLWADEAAWSALQRPGAVALMRHALAPGTGLG